VLGIASLSYAGERPCAASAAKISDSQCADECSFADAFTPGDAEVQGASWGELPRSVLPTAPNRWGGEFVLAAGKQVLPLGQPGGKRGGSPVSGVKISGTLNAKTKTIHVAKTEPEN